MTTESSRPGLLAVLRAALLSGVLALSWACTETDTCQNLYCAEVDLSISRGAGSTGSGTVTASYPTGFSCRITRQSTTACSTSFVDAGAGGSLTLTATPDAGSIVTGWTGCTSSSGNQCTLSFPASSSNPAFTVSVVFDLAYRMQLTVSGSGTGSLHVQAYDPLLTEASVACDLPANASCVLRYRYDGSAGQIVLMASPGSGTVINSWTGCTPNTGGCFLAYPAATGDQAFTVTVQLEAGTSMACRNPLTIEDPFDSDAGWTVTATTGGATTPTQSVAWQGSGGNGGGYRQMQHVLAGTGTISVYHDYGTATYDPGTQGAIDHINYSEDQFELNPPYPGAAVGTGFSLQQGGTRYSVILRPPGGAFSNTAWETASRLNLTAADSPGANFSATGGPITFGYFRSNTNTGGSAITLTHGVDNWKVEICR